MATEIDPVITSFYAARGEPNGRAGVDFKSMPHDEPRYWAD